MPVDKDFKRLVRARMRKTGEAYTAARANLLAIRTPAVRRTSRPRVAISFPAPPGVNAPDRYAALAGMSDASLKKATGCTWERWVKSFDRVKAWEWPHRRIVDYAHEKYKAPDWWAQMIVVGYERIRGLRERGQRRDGTCEVTKSRVFPVPLAQLFDAFSERKRRAWLPGIQVTTGKVTAHKYWRAAWPDASYVVVNFFAKGAGKSQLQVQHQKLTSKEQASAMKAFWAERLDALNAVVSR